MAQPTLEDMLKGRELYTHVTKGGLYELLTPLDCPMLGTNEDRGRRFYRYVGVYLDERDHLRSEGQEYIRDVAVWSNMTRVTRVDALRALFAEKSEETGK